MQSTQLSQKSQPDEYWREALQNEKVFDINAYAAFMLGKVSRTFALNIQVLPFKLHKPILLAYLFCRMADTLEDDAQLNPDQKIALLKSFQDLMHPETSTPAIFAFKSSLPIAWKSSQHWDELLVYHCEWIFQQYSKQSPKTMAIMRTCVQEMCDGMIHFTEKQLPGRVAPLIETIEELDEYCYYVAGTVGKMLCDLFALYSPLINAKRHVELKALCVSFGLGLQLTNILKDISEDGERNISFIPSHLLKAENLSNADFLLPENRLKAMIILQALTRKAKQHLEDALEYTCLLPRFEPRLRLFCLWPLFMAIETLALTSRDPRVFETKGKIKISRQDVNRIVKQTSLRCWSNSLLRKQFAKPLSEVENILKNPTLLSSESIPKGMKT